MWGRASFPERGSARLAERRRNRRRIGLAIFMILMITVLGAAVYGLRQHAVRISRVDISGGDASLSSYATEAMRGYYAGIIPRDSALVYPAGQIRTDILAAHRDIAAVSIALSGLNTLSIKVDQRTPVARWCGPVPTTASTTPEGTCYVFDANGFVYATSSASQLVNSFAVYEAMESPSPIGATLPNAEKLPATFDFARQLSTLGSPVTRIAIMDGEVDVYLASGTRVTYLLGGEQNAFTALVSARANMNLGDGTIEYVDLRFDGKVYLKKK